jgi:dextranase
MNGARTGKRICAAMILTILVGIGIATVKFSSSQGSVANMLQIKEVKTDKSMYDPGKTITVSLQIENLTEEDIMDSKLVLQPTHLGQEIGKKIEVPFPINGLETKILELQWEAPDLDFQGYLLEVSAINKKDKVYDTAAVGVDVSSSWIKFPRYGYLHDFSEGVDTKAKIDAMKEYHINSIEYYDWHYLHHQPLAEGITKEKPGVWEDWAGREIYGATIQDYIKYAKEANIVNMAYNMIYAGTDTFFADSEGNPTQADQWKLIFAEDNDRGEGVFTFRMGVSPSGNGNLFFVNPLNPSWQKHIFAEENKIFGTLGFDGWHGDTVGDWGNMTTVEGEPLGFDEDGTPIYKVTETYKLFLDAAKDALGDKYLSFNPVGAQGIEYANRSKTDVLYTEFWPWDKDREGAPYETYYFLAREIERSFEDSKEQSFDGKGKSLVVKAYINYYKTVGEMNDPGVILCDAAVYAAGGSRLEIGNGDSMLHVEYYPEDKIPMSDTLKEYMKGMSEFIVAYENILRDGQYTTKNEISIDGYKTTRDGKANTIWTYTRADADYEILHLINLLGTDNQWRDERGKKKAPSAVSDLKVRYYTEKDVQKVWLASPDRNNSISEKVDFITGTDGKGSYIDMVIPSLTYWDMIYMS